MIAAASLQSELQNTIEKDDDRRRAQRAHLEGRPRLQPHLFRRRLFRLEEDGFQSQRLDDLSRQEVLKAVKPIARREFPRSNKLRLTLYKEGNTHG